MKTRTIAICQSCGSHQARWVGRCPDCGEWGTVVEEKTSVKRSGLKAGAEAVQVAPRNLADHDVTSATRIPTGIEEMDRVLGGGLASGSVVLLAGEPGIGKSTLTLQAALAMGRDREVLLVCGEEAPSQVRSRAARIGDVPAGISTLADSSLEAICAATESMVPSVLIVDSIQTVHDSEIASAPGSVSQVRECGARLARLARELDIVVILVGHVTKDGSVAGPRVLEHLVDVVCQFEGDRTGGVRVLRALKNRFGSTDEVGFFEMTGTGLEAIRDASSYLLADRCPGLPGSVLGAPVDGKRPFILEIQALVADTNLTMPRRTAIGVDSARLPLLVAVLQRRLDIPLGNQDVYVSAVGGIRAAEPAADLPVVCALLSSHFSLALPDDLVAFGEVGLAGEIRRVPASERRLAEARTVGCKRALVPSATKPVDGGPELLGVSNVGEVLSIIKRLGSHAG